MIKINRPQCPNPTALSNGNYKHLDNKTVLKEAGFDKCMYCESKVSHIYFGDIEHIKPKDKFSSLEFNWDNLGYVCAKCNNCKLNKFHENTPYINPYDEEPNNYIIALGPFLKQKRGSERGELTILDIDLNRTELIERRKEKIDKLVKSIDVCFRTSNEILKNNALEELKKEAEQDKEYSLCVKYLLEINNIV